MEMKYTPEQQKVITETDSNILVSAAAGSGKTAVLVERIIRIITGEPQIDIDHLLIVTFTQAAASEMRERISEAISRRLEGQPEDERLQRQAALIHNAQITTIDSFCLFVLRNNFNDIGLDPGFRVADEGEVKLLKQDVLKQVLEQYYEKGDGAFLRLVESFSPAGSDKPLCNYLFNLYEFAMSYPWPEEWLQGCADQRLYTVEDMEAADWMQAALEDCRLVLRDAEEMCRLAQKLCLEPDGPYMYESVLEEDEGRLKTLLDILEAGPEIIPQGTDLPAKLLQQDGEAGPAAGKKGKLLRMYDALQAVSFSRLPVKKDPAVSAEKREQVKALRQNVKDTVMQVRERFFYKTPEEQLEDLERAQRNVGKLVEIVLFFHAAYQDAKRDKNIIDFQDMEHMALRILVDREEGGERPTEAAVSYRQHFAEVLIDEYQDSNLVQEALLKSISGEEEGRYNRFMVGDVKQSIYKFRLARPELFMEKYDSYSRQAGPFVRIDLHKNFRSRPEVLDSVNDLFRRIMGKQLGGVEYDGEAALYPGAVFPQPEEAGGEGGGSPYRTELLLYDMDETDEAAQGKEAAEEGGEEGLGLTAKEAEAHMIAGRIQEMAGKLPVADRATGKLRPASYRDIVILLRSNQGWDDVFMEVLKGEGIPVYAASKTGYFAAQEIQDILNYLRVIDNPLQDIPLFGVLKSVLGRFTERELALVKAEWMEERRKEAEEKAAAGRQEGAEREERPRLIIPRFYEMLAAYRGEEVIRLKAARFIERLERYRSMVTYTSISRLLRIILAETGYLHAAGALPGGGQRRANVEMLLAKAADFEQTSYYGLFHFIRYMEQMEKYNVDYGEANVLDENADTVRIMSIHKSKGLEFPICFVAGLSKRFNRMDLNRPLLTDVDYGIGAQYVDTELRFRQNTVKQNAIARKLLLDAQGEELRVLYVAMTRAKEKLILTGSITDYESKRRQAQFYCTDTPAGARPEEGKLPFTVLSQADSYLGWILAASSGCKSFEARISAGQGLVQNQLGGTVNREHNRLRLQACAAAGVDRRLSEELSGRFSFEYAHGYLQGLYTKTTVTELKKAAVPQEEDDGVQLFAQEEIVPYLPRFVQEGSQFSATERGSAYHRVMEVLDYASLPEAGILTDCEALDRAAITAVYEAWLEAQMSAQVRAGRLSRGYSESVDVRIAAEFLGTKLARRMAEAGRRGQLYKERPFVLGIPAARLKPQFPETETVLVQGIIDVYFEEAGELVVADYKTDRVRAPEELVRRYQVQLDYYAQALQRLTGRQVREKMIYSFALNQEITLP